MLSHQSFCEREELPAENDVAWQNWQPLSSYSFGPIIPEFIEMDFSSVTFSPMTLRLSINELSLAPINTQSPSQKNESETPQPIANCKFYRQTKQSTSDILLTLASDSNSKAYKQYEEKVAREKQRYDRECDNLPPEHAEPRFRQHRKRLSKAQTTLYGRLQRKKVVLLDTFYVKRQKELNHYIAKLKQEKHSLSIERDQLQQKVIKAGVKC